VLGAIALSPAGAEIAQADVATAARASTVMYAGTTSTGWPVIAEVTSDRRVVKRVVGAISSDCSQGGSFAVPSQWRSIRVSRAGAFKRSFHDTMTQDGVEVAASETLTGKFNSARTRLSLTWRMSTTFREPDGTVDVCDSGPLRVTLRR
jgi:hypothetical protein